ncbi:ZIP zinc transporter-domain-containing protein [Chytriomyces sp. MP71]|nr:ZIP zinc transporter-domain-containing protein [Chytriomyces sp. MP71]
MLTDGCLSVLNCAQADVAMLLADDRVIAFSLCLVASGGTFIGGLVTHVLVKVLGMSGDGRSGGASGVLVGVLQAFSAGVMLYMTFMDLIPEATAQLGGRETMAWFFVGVALFGAIEAGFDAVGDSHTHSHSHDHSNGHESHDDNRDIKDNVKERATKRRSKSASSSAAAAKAAKDSDVDGDDEKDSAAAAAAAQAGERRKKKNHSPEKLNASSPHPAGGIVDINSDKGKKQLMRTSLITFWALLLHNMPEGLGVYLSALTDPRLGLQLAVAICLHNIPEGMAVAIPLYASGGSTPYVLGMTLVNGLAEPFGVIVGVSLFGQYLTPSVLSRCLAAVGGIMACISIHELQPTAIRYAGQGRASISLFLGMFVVFLALEAVTEYFGHPHSHGGSDVGHGHGHSHGGHGHGHGDGHDAGHSHGVPVIKREAVPKALPVKEDEIKWGAGSGLKIEKPVKYVKGAAAKAGAPAGHRHDSGAAPSHSHSHSRGGDAGHSHSHGGNAHAH